MNAKTLPPMPVTPLQEMTRRSNAYPKLVQVVTQLAYSDMSADVMRAKLRTLLAELGE